MKRKKKLWKNVKMSAVGYWSLDIGHLIFGILTRLDALFPQVFFWPTFYSSTPPVQFEKPPKSVAHGSNEKEGPGVFGKIIFM